MEANQMSINRWMDKQHVCVCVCLCVYVCVCVWQGQGAGLLQPLPVGTEGWLYNNYYQIHLLVRVAMIHSKCQALSEGFNP